MQPNLCILAVSLNRFKHYLPASLQERGLMRDACIKFVQKKRAIPKDDPLYYNLQITSAGGVLLAP